MYVKFAVVSLPSVGYNILSSCDRGLLIYEYCING